VKYEIAATNFRPGAIVPMQYQRIIIDDEISRVANCRRGGMQCDSDAMVYSLALHKTPSSDLLWIAKQGKRVFLALEFMDIV